MLLLRTSATALDTHCYVVAAQAGAEALVIDPGAGAGAALGELLARHRLSVGAVFLTHGHADHVWDAAVVAGDAPVYLGAPDAYRLEDPAEVLSAPLATGFRAIAGSPWQRPAQVAGLPRATLEGGGALLVEGVVGRVVPAPGHTEGSAVLLVRGEVQAPADGDDEVLPQGEDVVMDDDGTYLLAFCGDVLFAGSRGRTDLAGGDEQEMMSTLRTLGQVLPPSTVLLPGHGAATVLARELATNPYLRQVRRSR
ncbi:MAG: MBL fold metallo-hydrolase [Georgenia sp.]